ncbi:penicillin-binding protein activator [Sphingomicrobium astaxanthinifaciens]|uniref:penicillin-binding protein activator n=1 Tax=Sphingomicrobium astaxanthinifaciens TaxID=1227949 RepID=UPI001FCBC4BE|nr:penicillin-binding protein activator [Sphingomicrobium astaxanthinifaciens]MCJ7422004.1 penicillin-binding protein activator [Sphingomicrobium astaxanthinifaciens]
MIDAGAQARAPFQSGALGIAALLLAGCQATPRVEPPTAPPPAETAAPRPDAPAPEQEKNRVAVLVPLSGDNAAIGRSIAQAATMALTDTKEETIRLSIYDTAGAGGAEAAARTALAEGNRLFLGPLRGENVRLVAPLADAADVPVLAFSNDEGVAGDGVYIMGFTPTQSIDRIVDYAASQGAEVYAGMSSTGVYGQRAIQAFLTAVDRSGGRVARLETYERSRADVERAARAIAGTEGVDMVLIADSGRIAQIAAPSLQLSGTLMGTELWAADQGLGRVAPMRGAVFAAVPDARFDQLVTRYRATYESAPYRLASLGYDATLLVVRLARDWQVGDDFPEARLVDRDGFAGVDGIFRFGSDGIAERALEVRRVTASGTEVVSPASTRFDD